MAESLAHNKLVRQIYQYIKKDLSEDKLYCLKADLFETEKPALTYAGFIPDVLFCDDETLIIGEAKTFDDFKTEHSYKQYEAYFKECSNYPGETKIIICVPWQLFYTAYNHFLKLKNSISKNTVVVVLSENCMEAVL